MYGAVAGAGGALGLILGGVLTEYGSWRWCLLVNVPIAVAAVLAALPTVRESRSDGDRRYDLPGAVLATGSLVALVAGFTQAARDGGRWLTGPTLGLLGLGLALLIAFVAVEARTASPLLPLPVVLDRNRGGALLGSLLLSAAMFAMFLFLGYYVQVNLGYPPVRAGLAILPFSAGIIASSAVASSLLPRVGPKPLLGAGMALGTAGLFWLGATSTWTGTVLPAEVVMSVGLGLAFVPLSSVALTGVAPNDTGVASALLNTTQQIGGALGVALLNTLYTSTVTSYLAARPDAAGTRDRQLDAFLHGYRTAFLAGGGLFTAALLVFLAVVTASENAAPTAPGAAPAGL